MEREKKRVNWEASIICTRRRSLQSVFVIGSVLFFSWFDSNHDYGHFCLLFVYLEILVMHSRSLEEFSCFFLCLGISVYRITICRVDAASTRGVATAKWWYRREKDGNTLIPHISWVKSQKDECKKCEREREQDSEKKSRRESE